MVWVSDFDHSARHNVRATRLEDEHCPLEVLRALREGRPADPSLIRTDYKLDTDRKTLADVFVVQARTTIVSSRFRDVLLQFDVGNTRFYEATIEKRNGDLFEGSWFVMNDTERKDALIPERSNVRPFSHVSLGSTHVKVGINKPDYTVSSIANDGVDMWREARLRDGVFFSDQLAEAFKAAKVKPPNFLFPVTVIEAETAP